MRRIRISNNSNNQVYTEPKVILPRVVRANVYVYEGRRVGDAHCPNCQMLNVQIPTGEHRCVHCNAFFKAQ